MSTFSEGLVDLVAGVDLEFGDSISWTSHNSLVSPYSITCVVDVGQDVEDRKRGMFLLLSNLKRSDLDVALNGSSDLTTLEADTVSVTTPAWAAGIYRVQKVSDPDYAGTVQVDLRRLKQ